MLLIPPPPALSYPSPHPVLLLLLNSPVEASSLLFLLESNVFQFQGARDEADVAAFFHQAADPPVIVELLWIEAIRGTMMCKAFFQGSVPAVVSANICCRHTRYIEQQVFLIYFI